MKTSKPAFGARHSYGNGYAHRPIEVLPGERTRDSCTDFRGYANVFDVPLLRRAKILTGLWLANRLNVQDIELAEALEQRCNVFCRRVIGWVFVALSLFGLLVTVFRLFHEEYRLAAETAPLLAVLFYGVFVFRRAEQL